MARTRRILRVMEGFKFLPRLTILMKQERFGLKEAAFMSLQIFVAAGSSVPNGIKQRFWKIGKRRLMILSRLPKISLSEELLRREGLESRAEVTEVFWLAPHLLSALIFSM